MIPERLSEIITERMETCFNISLGSGPHAHGQLLMYHDMFGLYPKYNPRMAKVYADAGEVILNGLRAYGHEIKEEEFPLLENWVGMPDDEYEELMELLG